jgi:pimeloyl-ACP methyl ester carboxylesterase
MPANWKNKGKYFLYKNKHRIFYRREGSGPVLLLLHGFPTASWDWHKIWPSLKEDFELVAPDFMGFGFSDKPLRYQYGILDQADLVEQLLDHLQLREVHILAHDYGDTVAQELLARFLEKKASAMRLTSICFLNGGLFPESHQPRLIQKLLISPLGPLLTPFLSKAMLKRNFSKIFGPDTQATDQEIDAFYDLIQYNSGTRIFHKLIRYMADRKQYRDRWVEAMINASIPMRLIDGALDPVSGRHLADRYAELVPEADVVLLDQIGHYPQTEASEKVLNHFYDFIKKKI